MPKKPSYLRLISALMLLLVTMSSNGMLLRAHLCQDKVKSFSIFAEPDECGFCEYNDLAKTGGNKGACIDKNRCCNNVHLFSKISPQTDLHNSVSNLKGTGSDYILNPLRLSVVKSIQITTREFCAVKTRPKTSAPPLYLLLEKILV